jgi:hypothetical protein
MREWNCLRIIPEASKNLRSSQRPFIRIGLNTLSARRLDHDSDADKGYREARQHTPDHLDIVPVHCYVVENDYGGIVGALVLHLQQKVFEIEDFHVKEIERNKEAVKTMKNKLMQYMQTAETEVLCCPYALKRPISTD